MKHLTLFSIALLSLVFCKAQNITSFTVQTNCPIQITAPTDSVLIFGGASVTGGDTVASYLWKQLTGPTAAVLVTPGSSQSIVRKLVPGVYTFSMTVTTKRGSIQTILGDQVTVLPAPPPPRTVVSMTSTLVNGVWVNVYKYSDGTTQ